MNKETKERIIVAIIITIVMGLGITSVLYDNQITTYNLYLIGGLSLFWIFIMLILAFKK